MYVTTFNDPDATDVFIRLNRTLSGAVVDASVDTKADLADLAGVQGTFEMEGVDGEGDDPTIVRIINPHNSFEYQSYHIAEYLVGD